jgi:hypothetical protein
MEFHNDINIAVLVPMWGKKDRIKFNENMRNYTSEFTKRLRVLVSMYVQVIIAT